MKPKLQLEQKVNNFLEWAGWYLGQGLSVIPLKPKSKEPLIDWKNFQSRKTIPEEARNWWTQWPNANIGIVTGSISGILVMDVDGAEGIETLRQLAVPSTWIAQTGKGYHYYFKHPGGQISNRIRLLPDIDLKADGGYVVAPPSIHSNEHYYKWLQGPQNGTPLADPPDWLLEKLKPCERGNGNPIGNNDWTTMLRGVPEGHRHQAAAKLVGRYLRSDLSKEEIKIFLYSYCHWCNPPMDFSEAEQIVEDLYLKEMEKKSEGDGPIIVNLADVEPKNVDWLWPGWLVGGNLNLLIGDPGVGKSSVALDLASRISKGEALPDGSKGKKGHVIILSAEDDLACTIRPRLDAHNADCSLITSLQAIRQKEGSDRQFLIEKDIPHLNSVIQKTNASFVLIDPLSAYLGRSNTFKDSEVRNLLGPLSHLANETGVAILGIVHLNKGNQLQALYRAQGSIAFVAAARSVFGVFKDPDNEADRILATIKCNLSAPKPSLRFSFDEGIVNWSGPAHGFSLDEALAPPDHENRSKLEDAKEFLMELLKDGPVPSPDVFEAGKENCISESTLNRAKRKLKIKSKREGGLGKEGEWYWRLPESSG